MLASSRRPGPLGGSLPLLLLSPRRLERQKALDAARPRAVATEVRLARRPRGLPRGVAGGGDVVRQGSGLPRRQVGHQVVLLRDSYDDAIACRKAGVVDQPAQGDARQVQPSLRLAVHLVDLHAHTNAVNGVVALLHERGSLAGATGGCLRGAGLPEDLERVEEGLLGIARSVELRAGLEGASKGLVELGGEAALGGLRQVLHAAVAPGEQPPSQGVVHVQPQAELAGHWHDLALHVSRDDVVHALVHSRPHHAPVLAAMPYVDDGPSGVVRETKLLDLPLLVQLLDTGERVLYVRLDVGRVEVEQVHAVDPQLLQRRMALLDD
mmetsp:Transcript_53203/g.158562  ORF Transcript_53203/g.158562 Transcript_53203/m.158562 type:complete len:324 (-) Transcript_53203:369-1340(-)